MRSPLSVDLRERFRAYITDTLVPVLKRGDTVILDNLPSHNQGSAQDRSRTDHPGSVGGDPKSLLSVYPTGMPKRPRRSRIP